MTRACWSPSKPDKLKSAFWPGKPSSTIPEAVRWFKNEFGEPPERIVCKKKSLTRRQTIRMWSSKTPDPILTYLIEQYGKIMGRSKFKELIGQEKTRRRIIRQESRQ